MPSRSQLPPPMERSELAWKWTLRIAGLAILGYEVVTEGRVFVITAALGMMGLPTVAGIGRR